MFTELQSMDKDGLDVFGELANSLEANTTPIRVKVGYPAKERILDARGIERLGRLSLRLMNISDWHALHIEDTENGSMGLLYESEQGLMCAMEIRGSLAVQPVIFWDQYVFEQVIGGRFLPKDINPGIKATNARLWLAWALTVMNRREGLNCIRRFFLPWGSVPGPSVKKILLDLG